MAKYKLKTPAFRILQEDQSTCNYTTALKTI